jgi:hypothetical protein
MKAGQGQGTYFLGAAFVNVAEKATANDARARSVVSAPAPKRMPGSSVDPRSWALRLEPGRENATAPGARDVSDRELTIVATSEREGHAKRAARIVLVADTDCFRDRVTQSGRFANLDLALGLLQWGMNREGLISISNATLQDTGVTMTPRLRRVAFWWPLGTAFVPLLLGAAVWWFRRR